MKQRSSANSARFGSRCESILPLLPRRLSSQRPACDGGGSEYIDEFVCVEERPAEHHQPLFVNQCDAGPPLGIVRLALKRQPERTPNLRLHVLARISLQSLCKEAGLL